MKRKPFVETPKDQSANDSNHPSQKAGHLRKLTTQRSDLYSRDRVIWDPVFDWNKPNALKDKTFLKDLEYNPNKDILLENLSKGIPTFHKMADWVNIEEKVWPITGTPNGLNFI